MVLRCDEALFGRLAVFHQAHRLVVTSVSVFELLDLGSCGKRENLVAHTDAIDRTAEFHIFLDILDSGIAEIRVARAVGDEQAIERIAPSLLLWYGVEVIVPRHNSDRHVILEQFADDVLLHAHVDETHPLLACAEVLDLLGAHYCHLIDEVRILKLNVLASIEHYLSRHRAMFAKYLGQFARVDAFDAHHLLFLEPLSQRAVGIPVAVFLRIVAHHQCTHMDVVALVIRRESIGLFRSRRNSIVAHKREGHHQDLTAVGRVGQALGITHHGSVEHHLAIDRLLIAEAGAMEAVTSLKHQGHFLLFFHIS